MAYLAFDTVEQAIEQGKQGGDGAFSVVPVTGYGTKWLLDPDPIRADDSSPTDPHFLVPTGGYLVIQMARRWLRISNVVI